MPTLKFYKEPGLSSGGHARVWNKIKGIVGDKVHSLNTETCFYVVSSEKELSLKDEVKLMWILSTPFQEDKFSSTSHLCSDKEDTTLLMEIGPRLNFSTPFSTNAVSICKSIDLGHVTRIEMSIRYLMKFNGARPGREDEDRIVNALHDRMTQCRYLQPIETFDLSMESEPVYAVDVIGKGREALEKANKDLGLAFDGWDLDYYSKLFKEKVQRNPTSVECFDLAQSNSEHSRHWFFKGKLTVDGTEIKESLFDLIIATQNNTNPNNVIKFSDNSSGILGYEVSVLKPADPTTASVITEHSATKRHIIFTAETHNFPTGVAPFPGATTGTGGRIRDVHCAGRGAHVVAGTAGYCFGNLNIPDYVQPWEYPDLPYPSNFASPLEIAVEASNGASDYGNKFGEPVIAGFARSFGMVLPSVGDNCDKGERREYIKPIMFSGGIGQLDDAFILKEKPEKGMEVVKIGGPVYRIGVGGGAASSVHVQGDNKCDLDFGAVQRGDAEMEQKLNRLIRACIEMGKDNPIQSIHDQGAGGNGNVLKELVEPAGAIIRSCDFQLGDPTISLMELWGAEYQETNALLVKRESVDILKKIGQRERCPVAFVGTVTGDGKICLEDFKKSTENGVCENGTPSDKGDANDTGNNYPVELDLEHVLGKMPRKEFSSNRKPVQKKVQASDTQVSEGNVTLSGISLPADLTVRQALDRVLRLPAVASKRYLTNKVDRCVTGLVAQQQCVGPLHTPLADVAVTALSYMDKVGSVTAIGEQPVKGLVDPACGARMAVGEALTNLVFARVSNLKDVKCSGNWMWAAKLPGEGAAIYDACKAMCDVMSELGIGIDGGKDSLSMAARVGEDTVKAPGTLVISAYVGSPDITATVTPDLKCPEGKGMLLHVDISDGRRCLGGSALAQCFRQIGDCVPDLDNAAVLVSAFEVTQQLIAEGKVRAGHDVSDGGLITCLLEMAFAGNCGLDIHLQSPSDGSSLLEELFSEELGLVLEVPSEDVEYVKQLFSDKNVPCHEIGNSGPVGPDSDVKVFVNNEEVLHGYVCDLRDVWEETSFQLERYQSNPDCVRQEQEGLKNRTAPPYHVPFEPDIVHFIPKDGAGEGEAGGCTGEPQKKRQRVHIPPALVGKPKPKVAVLREEGSNSDREMSAVLHMAGFEVWDVNMQDLCNKTVSLDLFQGLVFVGGFSYADVLGSAKGWAATAMFNQNVNEQFSAFKERSDTFSLGVCNGCQLMALLGWVAQSADDSAKQGLFLDHNLSERFECRYTTVRVDKSPSIMFKDMEGTVFGMWSAHGEGRMVFKSADIHSKLKDNNLIPVRYVDDEGKATTIYPFNPNGSEEGVAAVCSEDGRHLSIMPHPERCFLSWQCPWMPSEIRGQWDVSPWMKMFQNALEWSLEHSS